MKNKCIIAVLSVLSLSLSGCFSSILEPSADPTVFYMLKEKPAQTKSDVVLDLNVLPIALPSYIDKNQIVSLGESNTIIASEFNRWAESLSSAVIRIVYLDLMNNLSSSSKVYAYPISVFGNGLPVLHISILELAGTLNGESKIKARWSLDDDKSSSPLVEGIFEKVVSNGNGYAGYVDSFSALLSDLTVEIVAKISTINKEQSKN